MWLKQVELYFTERVIHWHQSVSWCGTPGKLLIAKNEHDASCSVEVQALKVSELKVYAKWRSACVLRSDRDLGVISNERMKEVEELPVDKLFKLWENWQWKCEWQVNLKVSTQVEAEGGKKR